MSFDKTIEQIMESNRTSVGWKKPTIAQRSMALAALITDGLTLGLTRGTIFKMMKDEYKKMVPVPKRWHKHKRSYCERVTQETIDTIGYKPIGW